MIIPELLNASSVVCSFGVGNDISFDLAMIQQFGATVHGFDPSPDAIRFVASQIDLPSRYHFHPYGLGSIDGDAEFFRPAKGAMYSLKAAAEQSDASRVSLPVERLSATILDALDIGFIGVLKMDIEGAEYAQIDSIVENAGSIGQLLIEFHRRRWVAPLKETVNSSTASERLAFSCSMSQEPVRSSRFIADLCNGLRALWQYHKQSSCLQSGAA